MEMWSLKFFLPRLLCQGSYFSELGGGGPGRYLPQDSWFGTSYRPIHFYQRLNMELDLQNLFGLHVHSTTHWPTPRYHPYFPPHLISYTRALLVSQDRRHLFVTPCFLQLAYVQIIKDDISVFLPLGYFLHICSAICYSKSGRNPTHFNRKLKKILLS